MTTLGMIMGEHGTANYAKFMRDDIQHYTAAVQQTGFKID